MQLGTHAYYKALDVIVCGIEERFNQPGCKVYSNVEDALVKAVKKENYDELKYVAR